MHALIQAALQGNLRVVQRILQRQPRQVNARLYGTGDTALHFAVIRGHFEIVQAILQAPGVIQMSEAERATHLCTKL